MSFAAVQARHASINYPGRIAVVVGGTSGLGEALAERLAKADVSVVVVGRSKKRGDEVVAKMNTLSKTAKHSFVACDVGTLHNVATFVNDFRAHTTRLDYLVLTQGIATTQGRTETSEGIDIKLSLHYYSRMAFARLLAPLMASSPDPRVLTVLSAGVHSPFEGYNTDPELRTTYSLSNAANAAGFYNDVGVTALAKEFPAVSFVHAAPGAVRTAWGTEMPWYLRGPIRFLQLFMRAPNVAAEYLSSALFDDQYKGGAHFMGADGTPARTLKEQAAAQDPVWRHTVEVLDKYAH